METLQRADSGAFRTERLSGISHEEIRDELKSYLAEYRFERPQYDYTLTYFDGHLRDIYSNDTGSNEPMLQKAARSIELRYAQGKNTSRESAEFRGILYLDTALERAQLGDHIVWASPPGSKKEGYGDYGFIFAGTVHHIHGNKKYILMTAYRIEKTLIGEYNQAIERVIGEPIDFHTPEEFLEEPFLLKKFESHPKTALHHLIGLEKITDRQFKVVMGAMNPLIEQFVSEAKNGSSTERLRQLFYTIEHMALRLRTGTDFAELYTLSQSMQVHPEMLIQQYGMFRPPAVGGSCGSSGSGDDVDTILGRNILNTLTGHILSKILGKEEDEFGDLTFTCGECGGQHTRRPHILMTICPVKHTEMKKC